MVIIQWTQAGATVKEKEIQVSAADEDFVIVWGRGPGMYRRKAADRFWIAQSSSVAEVELHSIDDIRIDNFVWSLHDNFGKDVCKRSTLSTNYGGMPAVVMARLESLRPVSLRKE